MSENVGVSRAKLESTVTEITSSNNVMGSHLAAVLDAVDSIQSNYQSEASKNLKTIAGNMQTKFELMKKEVETFATWLKTAASNYKVMEGAEEDTLTRIGSMFK